MDLRVIKTKKNIRDAFLKLRAENPPEKIRVTELCKVATINKSTFYKYYQDIYSLSEELENEIFDAIMNNFEDKNSLFTDPETFMKGLFLSFKKYEERVRILFSDSMDHLVDKTEKTLLVYYPWIRENPRKEIALSFLVTGISHVLLESRYEESTLRDSLAFVSKQIINIINMDGNPAVQFR